MDQRFVPADFGFAILFTNHRDTKGAAPTSPQFRGRGGCPLCVSVVLVADTNETVVAGKAVNVGPGAGAATTKAAATKTTSTVNNGSSRNTHAAGRAVVARGPAASTGIARVRRRVAGAATDTARRWSTTDPANTADHWTN